MNHWEIENAVHLGVALKEANFQVSQICCSRPSCFDFVAKKDDRTIFVKVSSDVDSFSPHGVQELQHIAGRVSAASVIVSQQAHGKPLEDDTVYSRNGIFVVTKKTVKGMTLQTGNPLIYAGPGGYSVEVDGELVEKRRKELGLSMGKLASMIGVSRRTLYGYERGMAKASVKSAYNLAETLGVPVAKPIRILSRTQKHRRCLLIRAKQTITGQPLLQKFFRKFAFCDILPVYRAPFDFIMNFKQDRDVIMGGVASKREKNLDRRIGEIVSVSNVIGAQPVLVTEKRKTLSDDINCVCLNELPAMCTPENLLLTN